MIKESPHRESSAISLGHMALRLAASMDDDISPKMGNLKEKVLLTNLVSCKVIEFETQKVKNASR